jgi:hypothetical protein
MYRLNLIEQCREFSNKHLENSKFLQPKKSGKISSTFFDVALPNIDAQLS